MSISLKNVSSKKKRYEINVSCVRGIQSSYLKCGFVSKNKPEFHEKNTWVYFHQIIISCYFPLNISICPKKVSPRNKYVYLRVQNTWNIRGRTHPLDRADEHFEA